MFLFLTLFHDSISATDSRLSMICKCIIITLGLEIQNSMQLDNRTLNLFESDTSSICWLCWNVDYYHNYTIDSYTIHSQLQHTYKYSLISIAIEQHVLHRKLM